MSRPPVTRAPHLLQLNRKASTGALQRGQVRSIVASNRAELYGVAIDTDRPPSNTHLMNSDSVERPPAEPTPRAPWVVLDTETTGLDAQSDRVIEVAAVTLDPDSLSELDHRQWLINPGVDTGPSHVHGITNEMVADAPSFSDIAHELADYLNGKVLIAHNLRFDVGFLEAEFARSGESVSLGRGFCTYRDGTYCSLANALKAIDTVNDGAHRALNDVRATSTLFRWLVEGRYPDAAAHSRSSSAWPQLSSVRHSPLELAFDQAVAHTEADGSSRRSRAWSAYIDSWLRRSRAGARARATSDK
ncbi:MAG: hypothetical protein RL745_710 [Actinomycetota bacterium]